MPVTVMTFSFLYKRNARKGKQMLAKNTLHLQYSPAFKAVEAFNEDMKRRGPWKLKAFWKYLCFLLLVMKKKETVSCQTSLHFCL